MSQTHARSKFPPTNDGQVKQSKIWGGRSAFRKAVMSMIALLIVTAEFSRLLVIRSNMSIYSGDEGETFRTVSDPVQLLQVRVFK